MTDFNLKRKFFIGKIQLLTLFLNVIRLVTKCIPCLVHNTGALKKIQTVLQVELLYFGKTLISASGIWVIQSQLEFNFLQSILLPRHDLIMHVPRIFSNRVLYFYLYTSLYRAIEGPKNHFSKCKFMVRLDRSFWYGPYDMDHMIWSIFNSETS